MQMKSLFRLLATASCMTASIGIAAAQDQPAVSQDDTTGMQEIIVTAQRRSETVQKTPLAITASLGEDLRAKNINDIGALSNLLPNISIPVGVGPARITMRGIGLQGTGSNAEAPVAVSVDGVFIGRPEHVTNSFFDVNRVEAVLGPQGTLYGRNATAGAVNIITRDPTDTWQGFAQATVGNYGTLIGEAAVGGPLTDGVSMRVAYQGQRHRGYGKSADGKRINDLDTQAFRAKLKFEPTDNLSVLLSAEYFHEDDATDTFHYIRDSGFGPTNAAFAFGGIPAAPGKRFQNTNSNYPARLKKTNRMGSATVNWDVLDEVTVTSITSFAQSDYYNQFDLDSTQINIMNLSQKTDDKQFTQELRLSGETGRLTYVVGGFYLHDMMDYRFRVPLNTLMLGGSDFFAQGIGGLGKLRTNAEAIFGQLSYELTDWLGVDVGGRYSWENKRALADNFAFDTTTPYNLALEPDYIVSLPVRTFKDSRFTPKATLRVTPSDNVNLYLTYSEGFKSGGFNVAQVQPYFESEILKDIEGGAKIDWFGGKLRTNLSAFRYKYSNLLVQVLLPPPQIGTISTNAGSALLYGFEASVIAKPVDNLQIDLNAGYLHGRYKVYSSLNTEDPTGVVEDLRGKKLPFAPDYNINAGLQYRFNVGDGYLTPRAEVNWVGRTYYTSFNTEAESQAAYSRINLFLNYELPDKGWSVNLFVKNLTDNNVASLLTPANATIGGWVAGTALPPRTFGATVTKNF